VISELRVRELGVIEDLDVVFGGGLTVISGETGAGKTLVVEALELLLGGRADASVVRHGAAECLVEGRFVEDDREVVLARAVPAEGRSRAYLDGKMVPVAALDEVGRDLVDLHGQHAHQSLLRAATQRNALDGYIGVDLGPLRGLQGELAGIARRIEALGGDTRSRERELDLLVFEAGEIDAARIASPDEAERLEAEEEALAGAEAVKAAAAVGYELLAGDGGEAALDLLGRAIEAASRQHLLEGHAARLRGVATDLDDAARELRATADRLEEDPQRLAEVQERRQLLARLVRKHGSDLGDVLAAREEMRRRIAELETADATRLELEEAAEVLRGRITAEENLIGDARRKGAPAFSAAVEGHLRTLALESARVEVTLPESGVADEVEFLLGANPGEPALPLSKVASGGELARAMLALRLVLTSAPPTLVFDEVDAGIGGEAALAVGRALSELARACQVLVVTHLAQVAAYADHQLVVEKSEHGGRTTSSLHAVEGEARLVELSRMLSGQPRSASARRHAAELLELAQAASAR